MSRAFEPHRRTKRKPSIEYRAWINGEEVYVFNHLGFAGGTMSWISFDFHEPVEISVEPHRRVDHARVLPRRAGAPLTIDGNRFTTQITQPGHYLVEWDGLLELPFFIFAKVPVPKPESGRLIAFGPGEHRPGCIHLESGDRLHLEAGAEVYGAIRAVDAHDIRITGPGILSQAHLPFGGRDEERHPLELVNCRDVVIDGPLFLEGCTWNVVFRNCDDIQMRNSVVFSERPYSTDGINPCDSRHVVVENCLVRSKDDCISVKGMQRDTPAAERKPICGIRVRDCLFWSDNNNGLVVGTETWASEIHDIRFERTDFVRVSGTCGDWAAAFAVQALFDTTVRDIVFSDIDVENCTGNPFSILYLDEVYGIPGERRDEGGVIKDIVFENIRFHQRPHRRSIVEGRDAIRTVGAVEFRGVTFGGQTVRSADDLRLVTNEFAEPPRFS